MEFCRKLAEIAKGCMCSHSINVVLGIATVIAAPSAPWIAARTSRTESACA